MQVSHVNFNKTLITNSLVENKTVIFTFEDQLADFSVRITSGDDEVIWLEPVFEGMGLSRILKISVIITISMQVILEYVLILSHMYLRSMIR